MKVFKVLHTGGISNYDKSKWEKGLKRIHPKAGTYGSHTNIPTHPDNGFCAYKSLSQLTKNVDSHSLGAAHEIWEMTTDGPVVLLEDKIMCRKLKPVKIVGWLKRNVYDNKYAISKTKRYSLYEARKPKGQK
jgi:hypothetical protein